MCFHTSSCIETLNSFQPARLLEEAFRGWRMAIRAEEDKRGVKTSPGKKVVQPQQAEICHEVSSRTRYQWYHWKRDFLWQVFTNELQVFVLWLHCNSILVHSIRRFVFCCELFSDVWVWVPIIHVVATNSTLEVTSVNFDRSLTLCLMFCHHKQVPV